MSITSKDSIDATAIQCPEHFSFPECLTYLNRSELELSHQVKDGRVYKLLEFDKSPMLIALGQSDAHGLEVQHLSGESSDQTAGFIQRYVREWFDLETDLSVFYKYVKDDPLMAGLTVKYRGFRLIRIPDLFEALCWSVIGQQVNLRFAYKTKHELIRRYGRFVDYENQRFYLFPEAERVLGITDADFRDMQFSRQKTAYIKGIAEKCVSGLLDKKALIKLDDEALKSALVDLKGIGNWSANYVMMRCFGRKMAFPIADVGLHNAIKKQLNLAQKPSMDEVRRLTSHWDDWQAYRVYYLWRILADG